MREAFSGPTAVGESRRGATKGVAVSWGNKKFSLNFEFEGTKQAEKQSINSKHRKFAALIPTATEVEALGGNADVDAPPP